MKCSRRLKSHVLQSSQPSNFNSLYKLMSVLFLKVQILCGHLPVKYFLRLFLLPSARSPFQYLAFMTWHPPLVSSFSSCVLCRGFLHASQVLSSLICPLVLAVQSSSLEFPNPFLSSFFKFHNRLKSALCYSSIKPPRCFQWKYQYISSNFSSLFQHLRIPFSYEFLSHCINYLSFFSNACVYACERVYTHTYTQTLLLGAQIEWILVV